VQYKTADEEIHTLQLGEGYVSLMALGLPSIFKVVPYSDVGHACAEVGRVVKTLQKPDGESES
jgi:hypothetical protein